MEDDRQAVVWYRKAADQGYARAQGNLSAMYTNGQGVVQNYVQAHKWYNLAAANFTGEDYEQAARNRSIVEKKMTPQQVAEAQRLASRRPEEQSVVLFHCVSHRASKKVSLTPLPLLQPSRLVGGPSCGRPTRSPGRSLL